MEEIPQNKIKDIYHKNKTLFAIIIIIVFVIIVSFLYTRANDTILVDNTNEKKVFSEGEKLEILKSLSAGSENILSIEERREILNNVTQSRSDDLFNYSKEGKFQILRSLQE